MQCSVLNFVSIKYFFLLKGRSFPRLRGVMNLVLLMSYLNYDNPFQQDILGYTFGSCCATADAAA